MLEHKFGVTEKKEINMELKDLKKKYKQAEESGDSTFTLEGREIVTNFAKYLIQHLENKGAKDTTNLEWENGV